MSENLTTNVDVNLIILQLEKNPIFTIFKEKCLEGKDNKELAVVEEAVEKCITRSKMILSHMGQYTLHDETHLFRVLNLSAKLLGIGNIRQMSTPELQLLILSVFFHDIGMAPSEYDVLSWKKVAYGQTANPEEMGEYLEFQKFWYSQTLITQAYYISRSTSEYSKAEDILSYLISEYIRKTHADRARTIIDKEWREKIKFKDNNLAVELAALCYSHNESAKKLNDQDREVIFGNDITACLPLIGIILRLADILDFDSKRTPDVLYNNLYIKNNISKAEWAKHRSVESWEINSDRIVFTAKCRNPVVEASIHLFCDLIDSELSVCNNILNELNTFFKNKGRELEIRLPYSVNRDKIVTDKDIYGKPLYIYRNTKFELSKKQVINLLMGTKLYGNPEVALRELIQNSIDACLLRQSQEKNWKNPYEPVININIYAEKDDEILEVSDNGTGMDEYIINNYYSKIGSSFYKSPDFYLIKSETKSDFNPTSRFGIGVLSCFMIADTLKVDSRRVIDSHDYSEPISLTIEGEDSIFYMTESTKKEPGTTTKLTLRKGQNPWNGMNDEGFYNYIKNLIPKPPFKFLITKNRITRELNEKAFKDIDISFLINHTWSNTENILLMDFDFDQWGISGKAKIGILVKDNEPVSSILVDSQEVQIEGNKFTLYKNVNLNGTKLMEQNTTITVNTNRQIIPSNSTSIILRSACKVSFHGIEVPHNFMPDEWLIKPNQALIKFPFQVLLIFDISGDNDLDLNSARTEILNTKLWQDVYEKLSYILFKHIKLSVSDDFWIKLHQIYYTSAFLDSIVLASLNQVNGEK